MRIGSSRLLDPALAAAELANALYQPQAGLVVVFAACNFDLDVLGPRLREAFGDTPLIGCTTSGNIGPEGYQDQGLTGFSLAAADLDFELALLENIGSVPQRDATAFAHALRDRLFTHRPGVSPERCFGFMLIDGLCGREESIARAFHDGLGGLSLAGGSAGDDLAFRETRVLFQGRFVSDAAVLLVATTPHPFSVFKTQHFVPEDERMVVTGAIPERRIVTEINGLPAAVEYARIVGLDPTTLGPQAFAAHPVVVRIGNADFVRSIQQLNEDGTLTFFCAIDRGIVLKTVLGKDMLTNLDETLRQVKEAIGPPALIIGCDCILRQLECRERGLLGTVGDRLRADHVVGFSTFGEQFRGMHINQTFTGIALGGGNP
ncbi:MAG TPA: FIST N-terminal domain-containing protein [Rhodocyclaceae bacterium]